MGRGLYDVCRPVPEGQTIDDRHAHAQPPSLPRLALPPWAPARDADQAPQPHLGRHDRGMRRVPQGAGGRGQRWPRRRATRFLAAAPRGRGTAETAAGGASPRPMVWFVGERGREVIVLRRGRVGAAGLTGRGRPREKRKRRARGNEARTDLMVGCDASLTEPLPPSPLESSVPVKPARPGGEGYRHEGREHAGREGPVPLRDSAVQPHPALAGRRERDPCGPIPARL